MDSLSFIYICFGPHRPLEAGELGLAPCSDNGNRRGASVGHLGLLGLGGRDSSKEVRKEFEKSVHHIYQSSVFI